MDDRAVSRVLSYSLVLTISTLLVAGLLMSGSSFVTDQRSQVVDSELEVVGQRLAADVATADRLVRMGSGDTTVRIESQVPADVAGVDYDVEVLVSNNGNASLRVSAPTLDRQVAVPISNVTDVEPGRAAGGDIVIEYDRSQDHLVVTDE